MSVLMTMRVQADSKLLEKYSAEESATVKGIVDRAKEHGLISHRFFGTDTEVLVVDEWPDEDSFQRFFASSPEIQDMMQKANAQGAPEVSFWRPLDIDDRV